MRKDYAQRGARTHDPETKSLMLYRLSYPGICILQRCCQFTAERRTRQTANLLSARRSNVESLCLSTTLCSLCGAFGYRVRLLTDRMMVQAHPGTRPSFSARSFPANNVFQNVVLMLIKNIVLLLQGSMSKMASTGIEPATLALLAPRSNQLS